MRIIYGTGNPAKFISMKNALTGLPIELRSLSDYAAKLPCILEEGETPLENARIKARAYFDAIGEPVFSCDSGLYADGLPPSLQIGVHIRRVGGRSLNDDEMVEHYSGLARRFGDLLCRYRNAVCFIYDKDRIFESDSDSLSGNSFIIGSTPHPRREPGFPLDCLSRDISTGEYFYDLDRFQADDITLKGGIYRFFSSALKELGTVE